MSRFSDTIKALDRAAPRVQFLPDPDEVDVVTLRRPGSYYPVFCAAGCGRRTLNLDGTGLCVDHRPCSANAARLRHRRRQQHHPCAECRKMVGPRSTWCPRCAPKHRRGR